jgi:hypothetical protein
MFIVSVTNVGVSSNTQLTTADNEMPISAPMPQLESRGG